MSHQFQPHLRHRPVGSSPASALSTAISALVGIAFVFSGASNARAGDILRGGAPAGVKPSGGSRGAMPNQPAALKASAAARDTLARTTRAVQAMDAMQRSARQVAARGGVPRLNPQTGKPLPAVPNGLRPGGLQLADSNNPALWQGALKPRETTKNGQTYVTVEQLKQQALLTWKTFNIGKETTLRFDQSRGGDSKSQWIAFNKVNDPSGVPSQILGSIEAPGQVYIINQNGIIFGGASQINLRTLVASTLPINDNLVSRGLLNNPDTQFLFSALTLPAGAKGTPSFTPEAPLRADGLQGDVVVEAGARISSPVSADGNGGRIMLVGANVRNEGTLSTPNGQTILAAGLQVGVEPHKSSEPSLRGLDVYVGKVRKPAPEPDPEDPEAPVPPREAAYAGTVTNLGVIDVPRGNLSMAGKSVNQLGVVASTTSVSLNGRIDLNANYNAIPNPAYDAAVPANGAPFLFQSTGSVKFGLNSATFILPEVLSAEKAVGLTLALGSQVNVQGKTIHLGEDSALFAPSADVKLQAGNWGLSGTAQRPISTFLYSGGQVYLDLGATINVAGTTNVTAPLSHSVLSLELRGAELAPSPLQRNGVLRGPTLTLDLRNRGTFNGREWIGTPLGDVSGYLGLIERTIGELTATGGKVEISAGNSVVLQQGSLIDVSGGWIRYEGGFIETTRLLSDGQLFTIDKATPDRVYSGIYTGTSTFTSAKWGITETFSLPLAPRGEYFEPDSIHGMDAGSITINAPAMALDGELVGRTVMGDRQLRNSTTSSALPRSASLSLAFRAQEAIAPNYITTFPTPPLITFLDGVTQKPVQAFGVTAAGEPLELDEERLAKLYLSPKLLSEQGFGHLTIDNSDGNIVLPAGGKLETAPFGSISLTAANIDIGGDVIAPGGSLSFTTLNLSPYTAAQIAASPAPVLPDVDPTRGIFTLASGASLNAAGLLLDGRYQASLPVTLNGGKIEINAFTANLDKGSVIDVSGGAIITGTGGRKYGDAGSISIKTGQDPKLLSLLGGGLTLDSTLKGYAGGKGGSLALQAPRIQIGGMASEDGTLVIQPEFFSTGGFGSFTLTGIGYAPSSDFAALPEVVVTAGTTIAPVAQSLKLIPHPTGEESLALGVVQKDVGQRTPVSIHLSAPGVTDGFSGGLLVRGDVVMEEGAVIRTEPQASVALSGGTVAVLGSIFAPSGSITISGGKNSASVFGGTPSDALVTTYLGPKSVLSATGSVIYAPDPFGRRVGAVLPGGTISVSGNIVAASGALLDVSGASGIFDLHPALVSPVASYQIGATSGINAPLASLQTVPVSIDSSAGTIRLQGAQMLYSGATLLGQAGGPTAQGGTLEVSSGRFYPQDVAPRPTDNNLVVTQSGIKLAAPFASDASIIGTSVFGDGGALRIDRGFFGANAFTQGRFDSLTLSGIVDFQGPVEISGKGALRIADGGVLYANSTVRLSAPYVALGTVLPTPVRPEDRTSPFQDGSQPFYFPPTHGSGRLIVDAGTIDVGTLSLQNIGKAFLNAGGGDIRGSGTFNIAGHLTLDAGQVYPVTASDFTITAFDYTSGETSKLGSVTIRSSGAGQMPLSAGGTLSIYASNIEQSGVLRAPLGTINIGWDGTGTAPANLLTGTTLPFPVTQKLTMGTGSITSVSAVDPATGLGMLIPYGISPDGNTWIDPRGVDITAGGLPEKTINLSGKSVISRQGSVIDLRGGGDLYAYRWVEGNGGQEDLLASNGSFAVLPGYASNLVPHAPFNVSSAATNLINGYGPGYTSSSLKVGDRIYLEGSDSLAAGYYTLLPSRYALMPGAVLVTPKTGMPFGTVETPEGASLVSGYRFNALNPARHESTIASWFEVASTPVVRARAQYDDYFANAFLSESARGLNLAVPRLPTDSGHLVFQATDAMRLQGSVLSPSVSQGRGSWVDISTPQDIVIAGTSRGQAGVVTLNANVLNSFGAESLLIGGKRVRADGRTSLIVQTENITVDNAGSPLTGPDLILASKGKLTIATNAEISSSGQLTGPVETLRLSGDGALVRVSLDRSAAIVRTGVTTSAEPSLVIEGGAKIAGSSIILDSTAGMSLHEKARLSADAYTLNSGRISILLDDPGALQSDSGLVLTGTPLRNLLAADSLSLQSYSSIDIYGTGTLGSANLAQLSLSAGSIRGFNQEDGTAQLAAKNIVLRNRADVAGSTPVDAPAGTLEFNAGTIRLGANDVSIDQFARVELNASKRILGQGEGGLSTQADLVANTPVITGAAGATRSITAGGTLTLNAPENFAGTRSAGGLGSSLSLAGTSVNIGTHVLLPSGSLKVHATTGDVTIDGRLDVSGTRQDFYDVVRYTHAGEITLSADAGNVVLNADSTVSVAANSGGGNAGTLKVSTPAGTFTSDGTLLGKGSESGKDGRFELDTASLPLLAALSAALTESSLTGSQTIRVRHGAVVVDGVARARTFRLSADQGSISVTGIIDASGFTGGTISLAANGDLTLEDGSILTVAGATFSNAGKGGAIHLEAGTQRDGVVGTGAVDIRAGSLLDLSVASKIAGNAVTPGTSAYKGQFSGTLHIRAAQNATATDLLVNPINGTILDPSSILIEGYRLYDLTASGGAITTAVQNDIRNNAQTFLGAAGVTTEAYTAMMNRLLANNQALEDVTVLAPGAELISRTGNLTLGTTNSTDTSDWNLATFRFGAKSAPGVLTMRAAGNLVFYNALSDGFTTSSYSARLMNQNELLPVNTQSWSYRLSAGADLNAADYRAVLPLASLGANSGYLQLGKNNGPNLSNSNGTNNTPGNNATTSQAVANRFQVIRTGSGDIDINAGRSVQLLNHFATIYTAGTRVTNPTLDGAFDLPVINQTGGEITLGANQQPTAFPALYSMAGGNVSINAQENIEHLTRNNAGQLVADSQRELPNNWLYRRGFIDPITGEYGIGRFNDVTTTSWWIDFSNFFQGIGALGGGDVTLIAGNDISNVDAVIPTNARMPKGGRSASSLLELGGGDLLVQAGNNIDAGVYYVERGQGTLTAGNEIKTNATRSPSLTNLTAANTVLDPQTWLPTTLFLGKGGFDVSARGDVLLGPVGNPFLLPPGINNSFWYKTYFSTYAPDSYVNVSSLGGDVTLREGAAMGSIVTPLLQAWVDKQHLLSSGSASFYQPWLRLAENSVLPFSTVVSLMPPTLKATAYSGDINVAGDITLSPAPHGTAELLAGGAINGLSRTGSVSLLSGEQMTAWSSSRINISDADPSAIPSAVSPFGYQTLAGISVGDARRTEANFLEFVDKLFRESGGTLGEQGVLQTKLALHGPGPLHATDTAPTRLYTGSGDISGITLFSPKAAQIYAGQDISDVALYVQNLSESDTTIVASGRDIIPFNANSPLRVAANAPGNMPLNSDPLAGDIQISGPGTLEVLAGRNLDLGTGTGNADGTGVGISSIGNARNPYLGFAGANIVVGAGIGPSAGLGDSVLNFDTFITEFVEGPDGQKYLDELSDSLGSRRFEDLTREERARIATQVFFLVLRDAGRDNLTNGNYDSGFAAIDTLFGSHSGVGEIRTRGRDIRTRSGGDISILAPGGGLELANSTIGNPLSPPGIITESGGRVSIFTQGDVDIGIGRIFTLRGGDLTIWSSEGDIAAGSAPKTVQSAPPTRVIIDPQSASVQTDLAGLATGGGIGVLATVEGLTPGNVDLIAPEGTVDAGDGGIRVSGNLTIAAVEVRNADNIQVAGANTGAGATPVVSAPSVTVSPGSVSAAAATTSATEAATQDRAQTPAAEAPPSIISVEVLGYGGSDEEEDDDEEKKRRAVESVETASAAVVPPVGPPRS